MKNILIFLIKFYKAFMSPLFLRLFGGGCRFYPTCSDYSIQALEKYGFLKGSLLSARRILRCHPYSNSSYLDFLK